ncbi:putative oxalate decarboxylase [Aspergillus clavatus NRRL 1]|uniref:Oxalate decarboxylase, putative n=1 Tax=Aspergillus clavatus (strain ATCC 1007 / CBS 513.65 / DSM 816 / NCTC 3887 / NRRL 1 / QM 1276 / 107) TaxID=344612 RepID=A1C785_ASPCL|nr:oxalate decarboxylase, putative [Aspergillus clavatus NRRL 1]EAW14256.1 oxalate decarboxylase, putative [Aspergillus clavatus NRRL 1]
MQLIHLLPILPFIHAAPSNPPLRGSPDLLGYSSSYTLPSQAPDIKFTLVPGQKDDVDDGVYLDFEDADNPQPIRGDRGGTDPGPSMVCSVQIDQTDSDRDPGNEYYDRINSDKLAPPGTDSGQTINAQWPMENAGWARQENTNVMPDATLMAGVDMRLEPGAYRELHWHVAAEWSLVLNGSCRIQAVNENGETFIDDVKEGDVWFFPPGVPHSIQALDPGVEFLLVFDDGDFSEDNTFLASEVFAHNPKSVLAKNFGIPITAFENLPKDALYIFPGTPAPKDIEEQNVSTAAGPIPRAQSYSYHFSEQPAHEVAGGSVKIVDPATFPIASNFSAAVVTVKPGGMREIHWHPSSDEWTFFIRGQGRATLFSAPSTATTFDYRAGDVGYFPRSNSHYIENTGDEDLMFLEVLQAESFTDIALGQWLASTSRQIVADTLKLSDEALDKLKTEKQFVVAG